MSGVMIVVGLVIEYGVAWGALALAVYGSFLIYWQSQRKKSADSDKPWSSWSEPPR